tara:strand:+ start:2072 stop:2377 length:306 start_codon:yes stop_codon:yes gene_type:complete
MTIAKKILKDIAYAYPTSEAAESLGFAETGCYYVEITYVGIEGSDQCKTFVPHNAEGFANMDHPDLIALYSETKGEPLREFLGLAELAIAHTGGLESQASK